METETAIMGIYRVILAILVALSHSGLVLFGYNPGIVAVVSFYIISGYVMNILITTHYYTLDRIFVFYIDRSLRLFPQFLIYSFVSLLFVLLIPISSPFIDGLNPIAVILGLFIFPLNYYMLGYADSMLIPQAWSLGLELAFYIVSPFILIFLNRSVFILVFSASLFVFFLAFLGLIHTDYFGFRLLPGTLFIFLTGAVISDKSRFGDRFAVVVFLTTSLMFVFAHFNEQYLLLLSNKEVLLGVLIGIPAVFLLRCKSFSNLDEFFGNISYGIFLNHYIIIWIIQYLYQDYGFLHKNGMILMVAVSALFAWLSYRFVEMPALRWRRNLRYTANSKVVSGGDL
jgi:peptidoglycan/LPS O-acetylase OafA/YrhL